MIEHRGTATATELLDGVERTKMLAGIEDMFREALDEPSVRDVMATYGVTDSTSYPPKMAVAYLHSMEATVRKYVKNADEIRTVGHFALCWNKLFGTKGEGLPPGVLYNPGTTMSLRQQEAPEQLVKTKVVKTSRPDGTVTTSEFFEVVG